MGERGAEVAGIKERKEGVLGAQDDVRNEPEERVEEKQSPNWILNEGQEVTTQVLHATGREILFAFSYESKIGEVFPV